MTYYRDQTTGLDYADQRYFAGLSGRFLTADPAGSGMNWYAYVGGDPVNFNDPEGLIPCSQASVVFNRQVVGTMQSFLTSGSDAATLALFIWGESGTNLNSPTYWDEKIAIGAVAVNRLALVNGTRRVLDEGTGQPMRISGWGAADGQISSILSAPGQFDVFIPGTTQLRNSGQGNPQARFNTEMATDSLSPACQNFGQSILVADAIVGAMARLGPFLTIWVTDPVTGVQWLPTSFNSFSATGNPHASHPWEKEIPGTRYGTFNRFYGVHEGLVIGPRSADPPDDPSAGRGANRGSRR